jgi:hypothetical protein
MCSEKVSEFTHFPNQLVTFGWRAVQDTGTYEYDRWQFGRRRHERRQGFVVQVVTETHALTEPNSIPHTYWNSPTGYKYSYLLRARAIRGLRLFWVLRSTFSLK